MGRERSKSVVQSIASKAVSDVGSEYAPHIESTEAQKIHNPTLSANQRKASSNDSFSSALKPVRTPSSDSLDPKFVSGRKFMLSEIPLYPFTKSEENNLVQRFLDSLNYNSILDSQHIEDLNDYSNDSFLAFQSNCEMNIQYFDSLAEETTSIMKKLDSLHFHYDQVMKDTEDFASKSTELLNRQKELGKVASEMDHVMEMFEPLESITKALTTSGNNIIRSGRIMTIISQLSKYLAFFETHKSYKDAEVYMMRYRQCMTRALTILRTYNIEFLKVISSENSERLHKKDLDLLSLDIMMYNEFNKNLEKQSDNTSFPKLLGAIADQCQNHDEYKGLISDVLQQYFTIRLVLVKAHFQLSGSKVQTKVQGKQESEGHAKVESSDIVSSCQKSFSSYKRILEREYSSFNLFFPLQSFSISVRRYVLDEFYNFLKQILDPFYDDMRNKILRESSISELGHLTNLLASYNNMDETFDHTEVSDQLSYGDLLEPTFQDSQARLIFRVQNYVDNKLLKYKPKPEDLQLGSRKKTGRRDSALDELEENLFPELYVPVGKALTILSNLYELVNSVIFDDIAHHIIHSCIFMLKHRALDLAVAHIGAIDAKLFYLKNLSMLKNHLNNFHIIFVRTETSVDFIGGIQELIRIFRSGKLSVTFNSSGGFLELVKKSAPKVVNDMIDAKKEIEMELSNAFNDFVTECTNVICAPILGDENTSMRDKATRLNDNVLIKLPQIQKQISAYIEEEEITRYLFGVLAKLISSTYESYYRNIEQSVAVSQNAEELNEIMEPETFFHFLNETITSLQDSAENNQTAAFSFDETILDDLDDTPKSISPDQKDEVLS